MSSFELAVRAVESTRVAAPFVTRSVREKMAIAEIALSVAQMDPSIPAGSKVYRLEQGIKEVRELIARGQ